MTVRHHALAAAAAILLAAGTGQAVAAAIGKSFSGTIGGSFTTDTYGWFSTAGTDLTGLSLTGSYSYTPEAMDSTIDNSASDNYFTYGGTAGAITVSVTVNGVTHTVVSADFGQVQATDGDYPDTYDLFVHAATGANDMWYTLFGAGPWQSTQNAASPSIDQPIGFADVAQQFTLGTGQDTMLGTFSFVANADAPVDVPEPASLSLLLAGTAGLALLRRRR